MAEIEQTKDGNYYQRTKYGVVWYGKERPSRINLAADTRAVAPVIAVVLMIAITVVLAATVFVLVANIAPSIPIAQNATCGP